MSLDSVRPIGQWLATLTAILTASTALAGGVVFTDVTQEANIS